MMNMMISTSMTSISGVMFSSVITSGSEEDPPPPICIPIVFPSLALRWRFNHERHFRNTGTLCCQNRAPDEFVTGILVATNVDFRLRLFDRFNFQLVEQGFCASGQRTDRAVPVDVTVFADRDGDGFRIGVVDL